MDVFIKKGSQETPEIHLDPQTGIFNISGKSLPEDVKEFYHPVIKWLEGYIEDPKPETLLKVKMDYFNTASSKMILEIFELIKTLHDNGNKLTIEWYYQEDDEDMQDAGQDYADIVEVPFQLICYQPEN